MIDDSTVSIELKDEAQPVSPGYWRERQGESDGESRKVEAEHICVSHDTKDAEDHRPWRSDSEIQMDMGPLQDLEKARPLIPQGDRGTLEGVSFSIDLLASLIAERCDDLQVTAVILTDVVEALAVSLVAAAERQASALEALLETRERDTSL